MPPQPPRPEHAVEQQERDHPGGLDGEAVAGAGEVDAAGDVLARQLGEQVGDVGGGAEGAFLGDRRLEGGPRSVLDGVAIDRRSGRCLRRLDGERDALGARR